MCVTFGCHAKDSAQEKVEPSSGPSIAKKIRVTGIPDENPTTLARDYQPLVDLLEAQLGTTVEYIPVTDYGAAVQALAAGQVDFAWLGGFTHVQARSMADVVPLVMRDIDREFHSVLIAAVDSEISDVAGFRGKTFAFGSKSSTSGHLMPRYFLKTKFQIDAEKDFKGAPVFSGAHDATVKMVESGKIDGGAVNAQVWERMLREGKVDVDKVKLIWTTPAYVDYVWTARKEIPEATREKFSELFLGLDDRDPAQHAILERMGAKHYVRANPTDFDVIESVARSIGLLK